MATNRMVSTGLAGVYYRLGAGKKRMRADGSYDRCFCIRYRIDGQWRYEPIGWETEGVTLEKAAALRESRLQTPPRPVREKSADGYTMQRKNAGRVGVYYRYAKNRIGIDGKPDKCYDILYKINGKTVYEKIGWASEGYTVDDAVAIHGVRVKALRHPELCPDEAERISGVQLHAVWEVYKKRWLPTLKRQDGIVGNYIRHIGPVFGCERWQLLKLEKSKISNINCSHECLPPPAGL